MKSLKFVHWALLILCLLSSIKVLSSNLAYLAEETDEIELQGRLAESDLRSSTSEVLAFKELTSVVTSPMINLENVVVKVTDDLGNTIYSNNGHFKMNSAISIETIGWEKGEYTLVILSENGGVLSGSFTI